MTQHDPHTPPSFGSHPSAAGPVAPDEDTDVASRAWGPVTVRVAWTLVASGVRVQAEVLRDAREHVLHHLSPSATVHEAEDLAEPLTQAFVARARGRVPVDPFVEDREIPLSPRWRTRLHRSLSRTSAWVLRMHHADGHPIEGVAQRLGEDRETVEAAREGLREVLRRVASEDGFSVDGWSEARVDALIHRLASMAPDEQQDLLEVVDGRHPDHLQRCPRSARAFQLVRSGSLRRADLIVPDGTARPLDRVRVLALHFHPDGRRHRALLIKELEVARCPVGEDLLLVDFRDEEPVRRVLQLAAELGRPARDLLRGALLEGPGRWTQHGLIGPLVDEAMSAVRPIPWATLDGVGDLPDALPPPPSARWSWVAVAALAAVAVLVLQLAARTERPTLDHPLTVRPVPARQGVWLEFDVDDLAYVGLVRAQGGQLDVLLDGTTVAGKARYVSGDGGYRLHAVGDALLVVSSAEPIDALTGAVDASRGRADPLSHVEELLGAVDGLDVEVAHAESPVAAR